MDTATELPEQKTPEGKAMVATIKAAAKLVASQFDGNLPIAGSATGHVCQENGGTEDTAMINIYETHNVL